MQDIFYLVLFVISILGVFVLSAFAIHFIYKASELIGIVKFVLVIPFIIMDVVVLKVMFNVLSTFVS